jgi:hypothetical protein
MDARIVVSRVLGLEEGDAHVIRNAGGVITERRDPLAGDLAAAAGDGGDRPHPPHRLRHAPRTQLVLATVCQWKGT